MGTILSAQFEPRREAEMTVERLVQEHGLERSDIFVAAAGRANTAGREGAGSDARAAEPGAPRRNDAALNGSIEVSADIGDGGRTSVVRQALGEFHARDVEEAR
ncbi:hypothetical protein [Aureimonas sp. AU4]|uniref:hypothetical protein n=1 Tax=Aureimonas sp. AU4 TaxID=1638163 RepID=UPI0007839FC1|nr:hypothetical protein [Aureimonas sp. AU4]